MRSLDSVHELEHWVSGTGQHLRVHAKEDCIGNHCVIHNPSDHHMKDWPTNWRDDVGKMERICPHGIGHPDPDDVEYARRCFGETEVGKRNLHYYTTHGCDGCCFKEDIEMDNR